MIHFSNITRSGNLQKNHVDLEISLVFVLTSSSEYGHFMAVISVLPRHMT